MVRVLTRMTSPRSSWAGRPGRGPRTTSADRRRSSRLRPRTRSSRTRRPSRFHGNGATGRTPRPLIPALGRKHRFGATNTNTSSQSQHTVSTSTTNAVPLPLPHTTWSTSPTIWKCEPQSAKIVSSPSPASTKSSPPRKVMPSLPSRLSTLSLPSPESMGPYAVPTMVLSASTARISVVTSSQSAPTSVRSASTRSKPAPQENGLRRESCSTTMFGVDGAHRRKRIPFAVIDPGTRGGCQTREDRITATARRRRTRWRYRPGP